MLTEGWFENPEIYREGLSSEFSSSSNFFSSGQHLEQHQHHKAATEVASCYTMEVATVK
jgi:hypothetical protein